MKHLSRFNLSIMEEFPLETPRPGLDRRPEGRNGFP